MARELWHSTHHLLKLERYPILAALYAFIDAVRSGKNEDMHSDILEGHYSTTLPHLANISYRVGRVLKFMGDYERFANDPEADAMLTRIYRHPYIVPEKV